TGFAMPARRGYYDLLLTRGSGRLGIAVTHWLASILPGLVTWFVVCVTEAIATGGRAGAARASGTVAAFVLVSTLPWAITVRLPRFTGAVGWLLLAVATVAFAPASAASWTGWNRQLPGSVAPP